MRFLRPLTLLLCSLCLLSVPATALAQSAGDEQYQDAPGGGTTQQTQDGGGTPVPEATDPDAALTDEPQISPDVTEPPPIGEDDLRDVPQDTANRPERLADTGLDTRLFLALGAALLLAGIGLRLRTIPERF